ncbi:MAG: ComF family protein [Bacteroidota bacterium]
MQKLERVPEQEAQQSLANLTQACEAFERVLPLWIFDKAGTVQRIHSALKYKNQPLTGRQLGALMAKLLIVPLALDARPTLVIPIPLHRQRLFERGYNQSAQLAIGLAKTANIPFDASIMVRRRYTRTQTGFDQQQRLANVKGAFGIRAARSSAVCGAHVLLVDDVLTTGATLLAAAEPLREAGAAAVSIATLAMARRTNR